VKSNVLIIRQTEKQNVVWTPLQIIRFVSLFPFSHL
jgi:hypothetical protein